MSIKNDLQAIMKDVDSFVRSVPKENILRSLIETETLNILVIGEAKNNADYKILWEIMKAYCCCYNRDVRLHFVGDFKEDESLKQIIHFYELDHNVEFVQDSDGDTLLSYYLGCDMAFYMGGYDENDVSLLQAYYLYLPILVVSESEEKLEQENVLHVYGEPIEIAATIRVLKQNRNYRRLLGKDGRHIFDEKIQR